MIVTVAWELPVTSHNGIREKRFIQSVTIAGAFCFSIRIKIEKQWNTGISLAWTLLYAIGFWIFAHTQYASHIRTRYRSRWAASGLCNLTVHRPVRSDCSFILKFIGINPLPDVSHQIIIPVYGNSSSFPRVCTGLGLVLIAFPVNLSPFVHVHEQ